MAEIQDVLDKLDDVIDKINDVKIDVGKDTSYEALCPYCGGSDPDCPFCSGTGSKPRGLIKKIP